MKKHPPLAALLVNSSLALLGTALAQPTINNGVLTGKIADWPAGKTGTVRLGNTDASDFTGAPIAADGTFSLPLPDPSLFSSRTRTVATLFLDPSSYEDGCQGTGTADPYTSLFRGFGLTAAVDGQDPTDLELNDTNRLPAPSGQQSGLLYYFSAPTSLDGSIVCKDAGYSYTLKGSFPAGWSLASSVVGQVTAGMPYTQAITPSPLAAAVTFHLDYTFIGVGLSLDPAPTAGTGYVVSRLTSGQAAEQAGVQVGDVVMQVDGKDVTGLSIPQVVTLIRGDTPDTTVTIGVQRGGVATIIPITIMRRLITGH